MSRALRASTGRVLSYRAHNHHLDRRLPLTEYTRAALCGVQDSPPGSGALALAARVDDVGPDTWDTARADQRQLVTTWTMRGAPYAFDRVDHSLFTNGSCPTDEDSWSALLVGDAKLPAAADLKPSGAVARVATEIARVLRAGPMSKADVSTALRERDLLPEALMPYCKSCGVHHIGEQLLRVSGLMGTFCFGPTIDGHFTLVRTDDWLGAGIRPGPSKGPAGEMLRRFLTLFGPADAALYAAWTGFGLGDAQRRFAAIEDELVPVILASTRRWLLADEADRFRATPPVRGVRLLPPSDPFLQQRDREVLVPDPTQRKLLWQAIGGPGLVLADGKALGLWRPTKKGTKLAVRVRPFAEVSVRLRDAIDEEAARVAAVRACDRVEVTISE